MTIDRNKIAGLLAFALLVTSQAAAADFYERYAAYQGRQPQPTRPVQAANYSQAPETIVTQTEPLPAPSAAPATQGRTLSSVYSPPVHSPNYNAPWVSSPCATCGHAPTFEPGSDPLGTCHYGGGGPIGSCGPMGCGPAGCEGPCPCGACGGVGGCDWGPLCCNTLVWARFEVLLWWRQGRDFAPIITTDPTTEISTTAGILPDAQILFGDGRTATHMQAGGRADFGFFTDPRQCFGIGDRIWGIGKDDSNFRIASTDEPVLAIPFRDIEAGANDALLVAFPGLRRGAINVSGTGSVLGNDVYFRYLLCRDHCTRLDFITGWNYTRIADQVTINTTSTVTDVGGNIPVGTVSTTLDRFSATNNFNGAIFGLEWFRDCGVWQTRCLTRMSIGNMHESIDIEGASRIAVPDQDPVDSGGGVFTAAGNIGRQSRNEFTAITEVGFTLAYRFAPCTQLTVGYSFLYFSDVLTAGSAIDPTIGTAGDEVRPEFRFRHADYWVQGINLGLTREF